MSAIHPSSLTVEVPLRIRRRPGRKTVVTPKDMTDAAVYSAALTRGSPALVKALARAFRYQRMLDEGQYVSITEMAEAEHLDRGYMGRLLKLTLLAPDLVESVLNARGSEHPGLPSLIKALPVDWEQQGSALA